MNRIVSFSRATVEYHRHSDHNLPNVDVTIAVNEDELVLRYEIYQRILNDKLYI